MSITDKGTYVGTVVEARFANIIGYDVGAKTVEVLPYVSINELGTNVSNVMGLYFANTIGKEAIARNVVEVRFANITIGRVIVRTVVVARFANTIRKETSAKNVMAVLFANTQENDESVLIATAIEFASLGNSHITQDVGLMVIGNYMVLHTLFCKFIPN